MYDKFLHLTIHMLNDKILSARFKFMFIFGFYLIIVLYFYQEN
jgi:hypothetical protein